MFYCKNVLEFFCAKEQPLLKKLPLSVFDALVYFRVPGDALRDTKGGRYSVAFYVTTNFICMN